MSRGKYKKQEIPTDLLDKLIDIQFDLQNVGEDIAVYMSTSLDVRRMKAGVAIGKTIIKLKSLQRILRDLRNENKRIKAD